MPERACAAILLAAGASNRLGEAKQLLRFEGESLVHRTARFAVEAGCEPVVVVVGAHAASVESEVNDLPVKCVFNQSWEQGIGSSLRSGAEKLATAAPSCEAILVLVCDQPALSKEHLQELIESHRSGPKPIVASRYAGRLGVPAVFSASMLPLLLACAGDAGARQILRSNREEVAWVEFANGELDIDTPEDLDRLKITTD